MHVNSAIHVLYMCVCVHVQYRQMFPAVVVYCAVYVCEFSNSWQTTCWACHCASATCTCTSASFPVEYIHVYTYLYIHVHVHVYGAWKMQCALDGILIHNTLHSTTRLHSFLLVLVMCVCVCVCVCVYVQ